MKSNEIVVALARPEIDDQIRDFANQKVHSINEAARAAASALSTESGLPIELILLRIWAELERASRSGMEWCSAEARYAGHTFQSIASSIGWVGSPHVRKAFPHLDEHVEARRLTQETQEGREISLSDGRYVIVLQPDEHHTNN